MLNKMDGMLKTLVKVNYLPNYNAGHNVLELYNILVPIRFTTSKRTLDIWCSKLVYKLLHELPNDLRLRVLEN